MYPILKPVLKDLMRQKGLSYKDLGQRIGLSESGVKKLFQANDCSLARLEQIAKVLEVELSTLLLLAQTSEETQEVEIDQKTQAFLQKNPKLMDLYWLLFIEELTPAEILERYKISKATLYKNLAELDRLKIIEWKAGDRITVAPKRPFSLKPNGPMIDLWIHRFSEAMIEEFYQNYRNTQKSEGSPMSQRFLYLTADSARELRQRLTDLTKEFTLRSTREKSLGRSRLQPIRLLTALARGSLIKELS